MGDPQSAYLLEVARRLEPVIASELKTTLDGLALLALLAIYSIRFRDGLIVSDSSGAMDRWLDRLRNAPDVAEVS